MNFPSIMLWVEALGSQETYRISNERYVVHPKAKKKRTKLRDLVRNPF